jgi:carbon monoxide dehydrogenase subunit G
MKYSNEIEINLPLNKVIELFENPDNMKHWQPGLQSFEHISGARGQVGARSRLKYKMGKREIEMVETITKQNLPEVFAATYDAKGVHNLQFNKFIPVSENKTKWVTETEFKFSGFMKLISFLMPGTFKKQSQKYLDDFKAFSEKQG